MPELLPDGLPDRVTRSKFDFSQWTNGQAWKFVKGEDYDSSTETFRYNVRRWAKANGFQVDCRPLPAIDRHGNEIPISKADPMALAVRFHNDGDGAARNGAGAGELRA